MSFSNKRSSEPLKGSELTASSSHNVFINIESSDSSSDDDSPSRRNETSPLIYKKTRPVKKACSKNPIVVDVDVLDSSSQADALSAEDNNSSNVCVDNDVVDPEAINVERIDIVKKHDHMMMPLKKNPNVSPASVSILRFFLFFYIAGMATCVLVLLLSFYIDLLINIAFYYLVKGVWKADFIPGLGSFLVVFFLVIVNGYSLRDVFNFLLDMWDFRNGFSNQFERFSSRLLNLFLGIPWLHRWLISLYPPLEFLKYGVRRLPPAPSNIRKEIVLWFEICILIFDLVLAYVLGIVYRGWVVGFYEWLILIPIFQALLLCIVFFVMGYLHLVARTFNYKPQIFNRKWFYGVDGVTKWHWGERFGIRKHPARFLWLLFVSVVLFVPGTMLFFIAFVGYIVEFHDDWGQMVFFFGFLICTGFIILNFFYSVLTVIANLPMEILRISKSIYAFVTTEPPTKMALLKKFRRVAIIFVILAVFFFFILSFWSIFDWIHFPPRYDRDVEKNLNYPVCSRTFSTPTNGSISIFDFALFSKLAYYDTGSRDFDHYFDLWFRNGKYNNWVVVNTTHHHNGVYEFVKFNHFYSSVLNASVISVRGTYLERDVLQDMFIWSEVVSLRIFNTLFPLMTILPADTVSRIVKGMYQTTNYFFPASKATYVQSLEDYLDALKKSNNNHGKESSKLPFLNSRNCKPLLHDHFILPVLTHVLNSSSDRYWGQIYITGHSLGAGVAQIVGAKAELPSIVFSSPGLLYSRRKYGIDDVQSVLYSSLVVNMFGDPVTMADEQLGSVDELSCPYENPIECHFINNLIKELWAGCGRGASPIPD